MSVKFQGEMLNFCDFIQVYVFTTNHHLKKYITLKKFYKLAFELDELKVTKI